MKKGGIQLHVKNVNGFINHCNEEDKLLLKPLSEMTVEERRQCDIECAPKSYGHPHPQITEWAYRIEWLTKRGFDVFGLIQSGIAINSSEK